MLQTFGSTCNPIMKTTIISVPDCLRDRTWYVAEDAYTFLVDSPITFGHSQLKVCLNHSNFEEDIFRNASGHIANCIKTIRKTLRGLDIAQWPSLASYTGTSGKFNKTLLLKASAKEAKNEYKIHLVPYFSSHLRATKKLYSAIQELESNKPGGLLHWVGQRERLVDYDMRNGRNDETIIKRIESFCLLRLASALRREIEK
jgi:hypothetical protein